LASDRTAEQERLTAIVRRFPQRRILVVGDLVADQFLYAGISRVSREAPVLILKYEKTETTPGGAANCAVNLAALDAETAVVGLVGEDEPGAALMASLANTSVSTSGIVRTGEYRTNTKVRILGGQIHSTRQQVLRIDYESKPLSDENIRSKLIDLVRHEASTADAIILSDYNYGVVDDAMAGEMRKVAEERHIPVLVDSRFRLNQLPGFTSATPNEDEVEDLTDQHFESVEQLREYSAELRKRLGYRSLLVTRGSHGMMLFQEGVEPLEIPVVGAREPVDVTGAGDTVIATYALALASGASFEDAARLANYAGGVVVMKRGTASISRQELLSSVLRWGEKH
jgi:rfaE bifunctional protein kinase chain/domain